MRGISKFDPSCLQVCSKVDIILLFYFCFIEEKLEKGAMREDSPFLGKKSFCHYR